MGRKRLTELGVSPETLGERAGDPVEVRLFTLEHDSHVDALDLHGQTRSEAEHNLEMAIQQAFMTGANALKVIHGKGQGALRRTVHEYLKAHRMVERFRDATGAGTMGGVTLVVLKS